MIPPNDRINSGDYYNLSFKGQFMSPVKMDRNLSRIRKDL